VTAAGDVEHADEATQAKARIRSTMGGRRTDPWNAIPAGRASV
jgi:hypothetical protein